MGNGINFEDGDGDGDDGRWWWWWWTMVMVMMVEIFILVKSENRNAAEQWSESGWTQIGLRALTECSVLSAAAREELIDDVW